ncbi:hypothetical protein [Lysobacter sp. CA199]|uniref:hypothetical protein n=1 Tax=Lysobacter sp. CA199 TaxID=3455608 RepID=UPI003F8D6348
MKTTDQPTRVFAFIELAIAAFLAVLCINYFIQVYFLLPSDKHGLETKGWLTIGLVVLSPLCVALAIAGFTLLRPIPWRWGFQLLPLGVVAWLLSYLA